MDLDSEDLQSLSKPDGIAENKSLLFLLVAILE